MGEMASVAIQSFRDPLRTADFRIDRERKIFRLDPVAAQALDQAALPHPDDAVLPENLNQIAAQRGSFARIPANADIRMIRIMVHERHAGGFSDLANRLGVKK